MSHNFFAYMARMKLIRRWSLMKSVSDENVAEHSAQVAQIAHALALIKNRMFGGELNVDRITSAALYHEASEVLTGDLPTPIKYYNPEIRKAYKDIEAVANDKLLSMLPDQLRDDYRELIEVPVDSYEYALIKAADKISAYIKCIEELKSGNREFAKAEATLKKEVKSFFYLGEVKYFFDNFIDTFGKTLDELE
ncbi:MAG: 5'-deoxynucleotidase [Ruminococcaceae bacterium]|nr:5'-deoxynucleotidase [Oscillospiraceae bacterium]